MDTCKRMWSENQIGEIAKENGEKLYAHNFSITSENPTEVECTFLFTVYLHTNTTITSLSDLFNMYSLYGYIPANGYIVNKSGSTIQRGIAMYYYVSEQFLYFYDVSKNTEFAYTDTSNLVVSDTVIEI